MAQSFDSEDNRIIGYEFLDPEGNIVIPSEAETVHIWNNATIGDYYFEKDSGIQLTNHYEDYWTKNIFCIGYYNNDEWHKIACADELSGFEKSIESDDETYVNATLWKDISYTAPNEVTYDLRVGVQYHLGLNDENLSITIYGKNIDTKNIPVDLGFAWKVKNVNVPSNETNDKIKINGTNYKLDEEIDLTFKNMTRKYASSANWNETCLEECDLEGTECQNICLINEIYSYEPNPFYKIYDYDGGLTGEENFLRIDWNENLPYAVKLHTEEDQSNSYVALLINAGHFSPGQEKSTTFYWIDALTDNLVSYYKLDEITGTNADDAHASNDGTASNARVFTSEIAGIINTGAELQGDDTVVMDGTINTAIGSGDFTVNLWVSGTCDGATWIMWIGNDGGGGWTDYFDIRTGSNTIDIVFREGSGSAGGGLLSAAVSDDTTYMITVTRTGTTGELFVDSVSKDEATDVEFGADVDAGSNPFTQFGELPTYGSLRYVGMFDEVGIWTRVLDQDEIDELYNSGSGLAYPFSAADTCTYTSGDWEVDAGDYCNITSNVDAGGNNIIVSGTGYFNIMANITADSFAYTPGTCKILNVPNDGNELKISGG